eukprot:CAMPEP_0173144628 /NCGR_PEP_ID=MMETSP1105-20130129/7334_1 /TAXON_ID=2985 /ORGANISM="Ochromonas sp., Strain BG-1" /LENGTH=296 /DNA_ID=CAMNT_0014058321 /DNA_START=20 /DNA_END=910 /DNA_ORIENTATION=+
MDEGSLNESNLSNTRQSSIELPIRRREREDETVLQDTMPAQRKVVMIETPTREPPVITPSSSSFSVNKPNQDPIRTEPQNLLEPKKRKLDRQIEERIPEIHLVGTITSAANIISDITEGALCRWKLEFGKAWQHLGGELVGQTQVSYGKFTITEDLVFSHPVDAHFAATGLQGWGAPRLTVQSFRLDWYGRRILHGYGFVHLPMTTGFYQLEVPLWRPVGTADQELRAFMLDETPSLLVPEPIYESAWKDRARMLTTSSGSVKIELFIATRYFEDQGILQNKDPSISTTSIDKPLK